MKLNRRLIIAGFLLLGTGVYATMADSLISGSSLNVMTISGNGDRHFKNLCRAAGASKERAEFYASLPRGLPVNVDSVRILDIPFIWLDASEQVAILFVPDKLDGKLLFDVREKK